MPPKNIKISSIGYKFIAYILLFSSLVTFVGTSFQLYLDYDHEIKSIQDTMSQVESSYLQSISSSLWYIDKNQVTMLLDGILRLPHMQHLEIWQKEKLIFSVGQPQQDNIVQQEFPLSYKFKGEDKQLGVLKATATLTGIYHRLWSRISVILSTQAVKTFLVSAFIFYIFYLLVGRHLMFMADYAKRLTFKRLDTPLKLNRRPPSNDDELETLTNAINVMREDIAKDIEDREKVEEQLKIQKLFLSKSQEIAHLGSWHLDIKKNILTWSDEQYRIFGQTPQEFGATYEAFLDTIHPDDRDLVDKAYTNAIENNLPYECIHRIIRSDGTVRIVLEKSEDVVDDNGITIHSFGFTQDITEKKAAEDTFRTLVESTVGSTGQDLFENICFKLCGIFKSDCAIVGEIVDTNTVNAVAMILDGKPIQNYSYQLPGTPCKKVVASGFCHFPKDIIKLYPDDKDLRDMNAVGYAGIPLQDHTGKAIGVLCTISKNEMTLPQDAEDLMSIIAARTSAEIERMKEEREKNKLEERLQQAQKMEAIGSLAGGIAHDFNNILGAILGYAEMVQEDCPIGSMMKHDIDRVVEASHRAKELVKQILAFSRQAESEEKVLQPALIIKEAVKMLRASIPTTINIQQDIDPEAGLILADPTQIHQIITNLCTNAFHAMEETGGTLNIVLKNKEFVLNDLVDRPHVQPGDFVEISVGDTGPGVPPEIMDRIFDPFFTTKEVGKGTGMGLAITHGIAEKSGGFVSCKSSPGQGTTFHVFLPIHSDTSSLETDLTPLELIQTGIERILFIDDEEMLVEMGKTMLERLGYRVTVESNSIEALKMIQKQPDRFDLVITDQTMPGMTGSDLARRILQIRSDLPIILCTGFSNQISEEKARIYGIKGFAMKPLAKKDLATLIRKVLDGVK